MRKSHSSTSTVHSYIGLANITQMSLYNILTKHLFTETSFIFLIPYLPKVSGYMGLDLFFLGGMGEWVKGVMIVRRFYNGMLTLSW